MGFATRRINLEVERGIVVAASPGDLRRRSAGGRGRAVRQDVPVTTGTGSRLLVGQVLRVLAVGSGVALGLFVWAISFHLRSAGRPQLEVLAVLLVLGVVSARAVPGVRWGSALTGVLASASAFVAAESVYRVVHHMWQRSLGASVPVSGSRLLLYAAVGVVAWAVTAVLLRVSDGLLPGTATRSVRQAAVRAVAVTAGTWVGVGLSTATWLVVGQLAGGRYRFAESVYVSSMKGLAVDLIVSALILVAVSKPAGLRVRDSVFLIGAGLVAPPLNLLPQALLGDYRPSQPLAISIAIATAGGLIAGIWATRPHQPNTLDEPGVPVG
jgi:hypothetical protein